MAKIMVREVLLILLLSLLVGLFLPHVLAVTAGGVWYLIGLLMAITYAPMYAIGVMAGKKMPVRVRRWMGVFAWVLLFLQEFLYTGVWTANQARLGVAGYYQMLAPGLFGLLLPLLATLQAAPGKRREAALDTLYAYSFPMLLVLWVLIPLMGANGQLASVGRHAAALFMTLHVLVRLYWPGPVEGTQTKPLVYRHPVPDRIVGLVEATARHRARPFATTPDGEDEGAISLLCQPAEAATVLARLEAALAGQPFSAYTGQEVNGRIEICVRPSR